MVFNTTVLEVRPYDRYLDFVTIQRIVNDPRVNKYVIWDAPETSFEVCQFMNDGKYHVVKDIDFNIIGFCRLRDLGKGVFSIGYYLDPVYWGNGYAQEIAIGLMKYAFDDLGARKVIATCDPRNTKSENVLKRCGMTYEGHVREDIQLPNGEWRDSLYYSMLATERNMYF
jgi:RimJ/RimL family protein N-acetyltransferase